MRKKSLFLLPILCASLLATSCDKTDDKISLTFGTYIENAIKITYDQLSPKMADNENMIVVVYPGDNSTCGCWTTFEDVIDNVVNTYHYQIYKISYSQFMSYGNPWNFPIFNDRPSLCFVEEGKIKEHIDYNTSNVHPLFKSRDELLKVIEEYCNKPNYYYIDEQYLDTIKNDETFLIGYTWSSCPDCSYSFPNVLYPFSNENNFKTKMYVIDLEVEGLLLENGIKNSDNENYRKFVNEYFLSNAENTIFGYDRGFVPTYQYWENGQIKDMCVYFNDKISKVNDEYQITRTYYTNKRINNLPFFANLENKNEYILENKVLDENEINIYENSYSWKQEYASKYHNKILETFLQTYAL